MRMTRFLTALLAVATLAVVAALPATAAEYKAEYKAV